MPPSPGPAPQKFNRWIDEQRAASPQTGLSVYPEGHRSLQVGPPRGVLAPGSQPPDGSRGGLHHSLGGFQQRAW